MLNKNLTLIRVILLLLTIATSFNVEAQNKYFFRKVLNLPYGGIAKSVKQTGDGGYVVVGNTYNPDFTYGLNFILKLKPDGSTAWYKEYNFSYLFRDVVIDSADNIYVLSLNSGSIIILSCDPIGNLIWARSYDNNPVDICYAMSMANEGNIIVSGYTESPPNANAFMFKINTSGTVLWSRVFNTASYSFLYFVKEVYPNRIAAVGTGGINPVGFFSVVDGSGTLLTAQFHDFSFYTTFSSVSAYENGGYLICGSTSTGGTALFPFVTALDSSFNFLWARRYSTTCSGTSEFLSVDRNLAGNYTASFEPEGVNGQAKSTGMVEFDSNGSPLWARLYEANSYAFPERMILTSDTGHILVGYLNYGLTDQPLILKTNQNGIIPGCFNDTVVGINSSIVTPVITTTIAVDTVFVSSVVSATAVYSIMNDTIYCADSIIIHLPVSLFIPNVFTPNGDGVHEGFAITAIGFENYRLLIYNRWGQLVYENTDVLEHWNGSYKGTDCADGTYYYILNVYNPIQKKKEEYKGVVTLFH